MLNLHGFLIRMALGFLCILDNFNLSPKGDFMAKYKLEYIWLDGKTPIPELRGKTTIKDFEQPPTLADLPPWGIRRQLNHAG